MHRQVPIPIAEYVIVFVVLVLTGVAVLQWLWPFISSTAMYPMFHPMSILS